MPIPRVHSRTSFTRAHSGLGLARAAIAIATLSALACREPMAPDATAARLAPSVAMRTLTGGSGTIIFPPPDPNNYPYNPSGDARALNNSGQVTGTAIGLVPRYDDYKPYRWTPGSGAVQIQGTLPDNAFGLEINDAGEIAGWTENGANGIRGFRGAGTSAVMLDLLPGTNIDGFTRAVAIN